MSNKKEWKKKFILKRDIYLPWEVFAVEAFKKLSAKGIQVLLRFFQKRTWTNMKVNGKKTRVYHNDNLAFTYGEAEELGISTSQFLEILKRLIELGFIDIEHQGGGLARDYSRYSLSERWKKYGTAEFKVIKKERVLWTGMDVRTNIKRKKATESRSCQLLKTVVNGETDNVQGAGKP